MKPIVRDFSEFAGWREALVFLDELPSHFLTSRESPPEDMAEEATARVIVVGADGRPPDFLDGETGPPKLMALLAARERLAWAQENALADFLRDFAGQLKDKTELKAVARHIIGKVSELFRADGASILVLNEDRDGLRFAACHAQSPDIEEKLSKLVLPLDVGIAGWVASQRKPILVNDVRTDSRFHSGVDEATHFKTKSLIAAPVILGETLLGALEVVNGDGRPFTNWDLAALSVVASVVAIFLEKAQLQMQRQQYLRAQGKAEVANSVLHNIGNVLSSVNVDCSMIRSTLENSRLDRLRLAVDMIAENGADPAAFFGEHPKGRKLPGFLVRVVAELAGEQERILAKLEAIAQRAHLMADIIETQQVIARVGPWETNDLVEAIEEAIDVQGPNLDKYDVRVVRDFHVDKPVRGPRTKLIHLLVNIIKNGAEAMAAVPEERRLLRLETSELISGETCLRIIDLGEGIAADILPRLFNHGFTTKDRGNGFGLAFCKQAMEEMGGSIRAESSGSSGGAIFTLVFPPINE